MTKIRFYGGVNTIGGNIVLLEENDGTRIILDFGLCFATENKYYSEFLRARSGNGVRDYLRLNLIPKIPGIYRDDLLNIDHADELMKELGLTGDYLFKSELESYEGYLEKNGRPYIDAILISHVHLDHCGYIWMLGHDIPIYVSDVSNKLLEILDGTSKTLKFLEVKFSKLGEQKGGYFPGEKAIKKMPGIPRNIQVFYNEKEFNIGSFKITPYYVDHSIPGASSFLIKDSNNKSVLYTGDFRFHGRRDDLTSRFRDKMSNLKPDILITEGTRITEEQMDDEKYVEEKILKIVKKTKKLVLITFAWKDITRFITIRNVCEKSNRKFVIPGKMAYLINELQSFSKLNLKNPFDDPSIKVYLPRKGGMIYLKTDYINNKLDAGINPDWSESPHLEIYKKGVKAEEINKDQSKYIVFINDFMLNELIDISPQPGSLYIRALSEAFDLEGELDEIRIKNWLFHFKINPPYNELLNIHASGHISGLELKKFITLVNPNKIFPIHTNNPEEFSDMKGVIIDITPGKDYLI
ncbi:MAG: MBL fold metallo-hydrolase [Candidatus Helarchaeota archaeon]